MTDLVAKERQKKARARAGRIRQGMANYIHTLGDIAAAYAEGDWRELGYTSWDAYVSNEFSAERLRLTPEHRKKAVEELRLAGLSTRAIGAAVGTSEATVRRDLSGASFDAPEETVTGIDGKSYAAKSPLVEAMTEAIEGAADRVEDIRAEEPEKPTAAPFVLPDPDDLPGDVNPVAVERYREATARHEEAQYRLAFAKAMTKADDFLLFDAERIAADPQHVESVRLLLDSTQRFYDRMVKARTGLRLVNGGRS